MGVDWGAIPYVDENNTRQPTAAYYSISLREHPFLVRSGMDINGASNMMRLPVAKGIDANPNIGLHRGWTIEHADYNRSVRAELDALEHMASRNGWDYRRVQKEVVGLQSEKRAGFKSGKYSCA